MCKEEKKEGSQSQLVEVLAKEASGETVAGVGELGHFLYMRDSRTKKAVSVISEPGLDLH